jgi:hypothetical protein
MAGVVTSTVIPGRAPSREPGIQAAVPAQFGEADSRASGEAVWIPGSVLRTAPE